MLARAKLTGDPQFSFFNREFAMRVPDNSSEGVSTVASTLQALLSSGRLPSPQVILRTSPSKASITAAVPTSRTNAKTESRLDPLIQGSTALKYFYISLSSPRVGVAPPT